MTDIQNFGERVIKNLEKVIVGKRDAVEIIVVGLLCQGHILIEDVPGVGKTMLARSLARSLDCSRMIIHSDSELMVRQLTGRYRVRDSGLKPHHARALQLMKSLPFPCSVKHIPREQNREADRLANLGIDEKIPLQV